MQGDLQVRSEYGKGSCFTVEIPQIIVDEKPMGDWKEQNKEVHKQKESKQALYAPDASVLVVDDNKMNLSVIKVLLKKSGIQLDFAGGGNECLEYCAKKKYDLILMDHMMPEPDGIETLHLLRKDNTNPNKDTTVIVLTANAIAGAEEKYLEEGFADYISKPVESQILEEKLSRYLKTAE